MKRLIPHAPIYRRFLLPALWYISESNTTAQRSLAQSRRVTHDGFIGKIA
jgi:hypothetical protein